MLGLYSYNQQQQQQQHMDIHMQRMLRYQVYFERLPGVLACASSTLKPGLQNSFA